MAAPLRASHLLPLARTLAGPVNAASRVPRLAASFSSSPSNSALQSLQSRQRQSVPSDVEFTTFEEERSRSKLHYHQELSERAKRTLDAAYEPTKQTSESLSALRNSQSPLYAIVEMKGRPYFVTAGDIIVAERMSELQLGDVISFDRIREIGNKDYALRGAPLVSPRFCSIRAVCTEHTKSGPTVIQKRRRKGQRPVVIHKDAVTMLRVSEIAIPDDL